MNTLGYPRSNMKIEFVIYELHVNFFKNFNTKLIDDLQ